MSRQSIESEVAKAKLTALLRAAKEASDAAKVATEAADIYLNGLCDGLGIDRAKVEGYDDETGELDVLGDDQKDE